MKLHIFRLALLLLTNLLVLDGQAATLRLSGSNTVGADLGPALVQAWLKSKGAVIVHKENPIANLNKAQIRDIFLGKISDWQEIGDDQGFVSQKLFASASKPNENCPEDVIDLTQGAKRLSVNIRFEPDGKKTGG